MTIKVSRFYRNTITFDALRRQVVPDLAKNVVHGPLRICSAGCGCGEEPYTLAMLLVEAGLHGFIEATDVDPAALTTALAGRYSATSLVELPEELRERYVEPAHATDCRLSRGAGA